MLAVLDVLLTRTLLFGLPSHALAPLKGAPNVGAFIRWNISVRLMIIMPKIIMVMKNLRPLQITYYLNIGIDRLFMRKNT